MSEKQYRQYRKRINQIIRRKKILIGVAILAGIILILATFIIASNERNMTISYMLVHGIIGGELVVMLMSFGLVTYLIADLCLFINDYDLTREEFFELRRIYGNKD
jgi:uncharacterized membrane protein